MLRRLQNGPFVQNVLLVCLTAGLIGCQPTASNVAPAETDIDASPAVSDADGDEPEAPEGTAAGGDIDLTPLNTTVAFVGSHIVESGPDPDARHGTFEGLSGTATVADGKLSSVRIEIETASLSTGNDKLDGHLKSPDFFDVRENPIATFTSSSIEPAADGSVTITGDFQLLKETKPISFPAEYTAAPFTLSADFELDRTEFGMDYKTEGIEKAVQMTVTIK